MSISTCDATGTVVLHRRRATFDLLPENVLLDIFATRKYEDANPWRWDRLAHVCRTWRRVVLSSPRRLNLLLLCTYGKPVVDILDHWSGFPIFIDYDPDKRRSLTPEDEDNIIYALQHSSRIFRMSFPVTSSLAAKLATAPWEKTHFRCWFTSPFPGFLNASAPELKLIRLGGVVVPSLPNILTSTGDLRNLFIRRIPEAGYLSPAALTPHISAMTHLSCLDIHYLPSASHPQAAGRARSPPSLTTVVLPGL
ncbi:hypothetical protein BC834DRAFT_976494 [Gloeopeniophorella convolvens]|nr:hypothetical protein BC834DRAFT_976494 [Gloeopeniophorella convolvens]